MSDKKERITIIIAGLVVGLLGALLVLAGNPANMGFCIACFIRDTAGALKLHSAGVVQYIRPEIIGLVLGAMIMSMVRKEFQPKGGSSPFTRFVLGFAVMVGALMFLGCPLRMVLRLAGGDLNALVALAGFVCGILGGVFFLNKGYSLGRSYKMKTLEGVAFPAVQVGLLILLVGFPTLLAFSAEGPGSLHAAVGIALGAGILAGVLAQISRLCMVGGIRDLILFKDTKLITGFVMIFAACLVGNLVLGKFNLGFAGQPVAHTAHIWNFLGMVLVGLGSVLLGGCPLRQLILAGEGNADSAVTVVGYAVGAACCHNFGLASSGNGPTANGQIAVVIGLVVCVVIGFMNSKKNA
ncbi:MAG: YedE-related selenium metabolism membrane protein [Firmicutes bacterium]|nr:YedE-related selenium metabolism membrane protein [Bacillota bacterium]